MRRDGQRVPASEIRNRPCGFVPNRPPGPINLLYAQWSSDTAATAAAGPEGSDREERRLHTAGAGSSTGQPSAEAIGFER